MFLEVTPWSAEILTVVLEQGRFPVNKRVESEGPACSFSESLSNLPSHSPLAFWLALRLESSFL